MRSEIKEWKNNKKEKPLALHFFKFLCQPTFGTPARTAGGFAKSHEPIHNQNFAKESNLANAPFTSILVIANWNNYDR
jgi:hypothetical protein